MPSKKWDLEHRDFLRIYQRNYQQAKTKNPEEKLKLQNHKKKYYLWKSQSALFRNILIDT